MVRKGGIRMIKYYCDKCGKELNPEDIVPWTIHKDLCKAINKFVYLCDECEKEFKIFIENGLDL